MDSPPAPRPRRRWLRRLLVTAAVVVVALVVATWFAPQVVAGTSLRDRVLATAGGSLDGTLAVDTMALGWFSPVEMRGVSVTDTAGRKVIEAESVRTTKTLWRLALAGGDYGGVTVEKPVVHVVLDGDTTNLEQVLSKYLKDDGKPRGEYRTGLTLQVNDGRVVVTDAAHPGEHVLDAVSATVTMPRPRSEPITVAVKASAPDASAPGSVTADASVGAETTASVVAHDLPLAAFEPLVRRLSPKTTAAGRLEADMKLTRTGGETPVTTLTGTAAIAGLDAGGGAWARGDRVKLDRVSLNAGRVSLDAGVLKLHDTTVKCDAGHLIATAEVSTKDPVGELFSTPGLAVSFDVDAAKLAGIAPRLLRVRPGTALNEGKLKGEITSKKGDAGTQWAGTLDASALRGTRDGKPVAWEKPLHAAFAGHLRSDDDLPVFDKLTCEADFIGLAGRGSVEKFLVEANVDLDRLAARLADFVDLGGATLGGTGAVTVKVDPAPGGGFTAGLSARVLNFRYSEPGGDSVTEPEVTSTAAARGTRGKGQPFRVEAFEARVLAGADQLAVRLAEPMPDLKTSWTGKAEVGLTGDLARWRGRAGRFAPVPDNWVIAGTGPVVATVALTPAGVTVEKATANLTNAKFDGAGVLLDEPALKLETGLTWERASGNVTLTDVTVHGPTLVLTTPSVAVTRTPAGRAVATTAKVTADLSRVTRMLKLNLSPSSTVIGTAIGTVVLNVDGPTTGFDTDFVVDDFRYGNPAKPLWREPKLVLKAKGTYDPAADALTLPALTVAGAGLSVVGNATLGLSGPKPFDAAGTLGYDLAKLEPQLKEMLGATATARGTGQKPFRATAPLGGPDPLAALAAQAGLSWDTVKAYGFDVGPAELTATAANGKLTFTPITAAFGAGGGTVRVEPTLDLTSPGYDLSVKPGQIVDRTKLTPEACASALGYALPAFAGAARATGEASFRVDESRIPLTDVQRGTVKGLLTVHTADVSAGPMVSKIAELLGAQQTSMTLSKEQQVPVRLENGRVHHEKFTIRLGGTEVVSSGSVGLDQTVKVTLDMPVPAKFIDSALAKNPVIRDSLSKQRIQIPVDGTLKQPRLDETAARAAVAALLKNVGKDVLGGAKEKLTDKLRQELEKKLPFGPKKP